MKQFIDITYPIQDGMVHWPGDVDIEISKTASIAQGDDANSTSVAFSVHTGTHMDAPNHFLKNGKSLDEVSFQALIGPARVIEIKDNVCIRKEELMEYDLKKGDRLLFKTKNSETDWTKQPFKENFVYIDTEAGAYMSEVGIQTIGVDYLSVGSQENGEEVHKVLLENEVWLIEGLDLRKVEPGTYNLICLPIKIKGADGAPVRALLERS
ncbi:MAG: cyclase family protein [Cytophagaceae bacterium]